MGTFMASIAFRPGENWNKIKPEIDKMYQDIPGLVTNLDQSRSAYAIVSPYGDEGPYLSEMVGPISRLTGGYAVMAICVDSDMNILDLYRNGELVERCGIGGVYEELAEVDDFAEPNPENWKPLLLDPAQEAALQDVFFEEEVFAEDSLRKLSVLTGLPIFDDGLVFAE